MKRPKVVGQLPTLHDRGHRLRFGFAAVAMLTAFASAGLGACATSDETAMSGRPEQSVVLVVDSGADADAEVDSGQCAADCDYFPPDCSADVLCSNGLFDPKKPTGGPSHLDMRMTVQLIRGRSANDVWVLGGLGAQRHFDGTSWGPSELPASAISPMGHVPALATIWLRDASEVGFNGISTTSRSYSRGLVAPPDGGLGADGWTEHAPPSLPPMRPFRRDAQRVTFGWGPPGSEWFWLATGKTDLVFPVNPPALIRVRVADAGTITGEIKVLDAGSFVGMHGVSPDDFWAVGMDGAAVRVTGGSGASPTITRYNSRTRNALYGVWAASESDVWAVGFNGTVRRYTGDALLWEVVSDVPAGIHLNAIWGTSASDIWAVGNEAVVLHYDGIRWSRVKIGGLGSRRPDLLTVWASDSQHVWIGGEGVVLSLGGRP
ncbi:MAG: hypothetical protein KF894_14035 [Labilithrix sp.]|nr:hypothetical protein [Labilithrix sp.]